jgi:hypothetical protein
MTYEFLYDGISRPRWEKVITAESGETFRVELVYENELDRQSLSLEDVYQHLDNIVEYIKEKASEIYYVRVGEPLSNDGWHLGGGWAEIEWANAEALKWWEFVHYNDAFDPEEPA